VVSDLFLGKDLWGKKNFRVETYSDIFKLQRYVVTCINPWSGNNTCCKYKWLLSAHVLATLVTPVGTPSSGSTSKITCIWISLDILKPFVDKPIDHLTTIVSPRTTLGKRLSSTWVVGKYNKGYSLASLVGALRYWAEYYYWTPHVYKRDISQGKYLTVDTLQTQTLGMTTIDLFHCNLSLVKLFHCRNTPC
jgi:hypothetical protein